MNERYEKYKAGLDKLRKDQHPIDEALEALDFLREASNDPSSTI